jgi:hypothetical protein
MGDWADFFVDRMIDRACGIPYADDQYDEEPQYLVCQRCGKAGLVWGQREDGAWRLFEPSRRSRPEKIHVCAIKTYGVDLSGFMSSL